MPPNDPAQYYLPPVPQHWRDPAWPAVSVSLLTYNQEATIGRALDSILAQETDFAYEIVVGDDCSSDRTPAILREYQRRYPDRIVLNLHPRRYDNVVGRINNVTNLLSCRGKYTAMLDGDDYYTDPRKLQSQYDFLENHPDYAMATHETQVVRVDERGNHRCDLHLSSEVEDWVVHPGRWSHAELARHRHLFVHNSSWFFRTRIFGDFPDDFHDVIAGDYYLFMLVTQRGPVHFDPTIRSVYCKTPVSITVDPVYDNVQKWRRMLLDMKLYRRKFPATRQYANYQKYALVYHENVLNLYLAGRATAAESWRSILYVLLRHPARPLGFVRKQLTRLRGQAVE